MIYEVGRFFEASIIFSEYSEGNYKRVKGQILDDPRKKDHIMFSFSVILLQVVSK